MTPADLQPLCDQLNRELAKHQTLTVDVLGENLEDFGASVLDDDELNTVLAALRWYQHCGMGDPINRPLWLNDIATDGDFPATSGLNANEIDELCEALNCRTSE